MIFAGTLHRRSIVQTGRRLRQVTNFVRLLLGPESADPAMLAVFLVPITGNPLSARRHVTPNTTDPNEIGLSVVPSPIAWNPLDVVSLWFVLRCDFVDRLRGYVVDQRRRFNVCLMNRSECFVERTSGQDLNIFVLKAGRSYRCQMSNGGGSVSIAGAT